MPITHNPRQQPVATALQQQLEQVLATANAIEDNAKDEGGQPLSLQFVSECRSQIYRISAALTRASLPVPAPTPAPFLPTFPSFTGKELL